MRRFSLDSCKPSRVLKSIFQTRIALYPSVTLAIHTS